MLRSKPLAAAPALAKPVVYRFTARMRPNGTITGRLHLNFSYQTIGYTWNLTLVGYVCQGDATFKARPLARG
jgi:hypothetical protein